MMFWKYPFGKRWLHVAARTKSEARAKMKRAISILNCDPIRRMKIGEGASIERITREEYLDAWRSKPEHVLPNMPVLTPLTPLPI